MFLLSRGGGGGISKGGHYFLSRGEGHWHGGGGTKGSPCLMVMVMVSWCQRQVPPPAGSSCPRSRPGQRGTILQQVQHPVRRSANPLPPSPHCRCPRHTAWAATGPTTQPGPHAGPCAHRAPNVFSSVKSKKFCMGTHPMPSDLPKAINSAWAHTQCLPTCQKQ